MLKSLYIASTQGSGGKTTIAVGLCVALRRRGLVAGYFKPVGTLASEFGGVLLDEDAALTELTVRMIRGQIGFIAERFFRPEHEAARAALAAWVDDLRAIEELGLKKDFPAARMRLAAMAPPPSALLAAEKTSLYDPATVKEVLR